MARQAPFQQSRVIYVPMLPLLSPPQCPFLKGKQKYRNKCDRANIQTPWIKLLRQSHIITIKKMPYTVNLPVLLHTSGWLKLSKEVIRVERVVDCLD